MAAQHFFVEGRYLGTRQIETFRRVPGLEIRAHRSHVNYCGFCGEIWARFLHEVSGVYTDIRCLPCKKHGYGLLASNPAHTDCPLRFESDWPDAAVEYEFHATLDWYERTFHAK